MIIDKNSRILITGASGLVGSALLEHLHELGYLQTFSFTRKECNLLDRAETLALFKEVSPDYVFHLAATVYGIVGNMKNHAPSFFENSLMNLHVVDACWQVKVKKIVAMGTCAAYPDPPTFPLQEADFFMGEPHGSEYGYAQAKRSLLAQLMAYQKTYGLLFSYVISTNLYGPRDTFDTENGHVIPSLIKKFYEAKKSNNKVIVWGDGTAQRDFLYSKDAARALLTILQEIEGPVNMGSGVISSIKEAVDFLATELNMQHQIEWDAKMPNGRDFHGMDISKLQSCGYHPMVSLQQGLREAYNWYTKQVSEK